MKTLLNFSQRFKALLLVGLLAGPLLADKTMAQTEYTQSWNPADVYTDGDGNQYAYWNDLNNWSLSEVPGITDTNSASPGYGDLYAASFIQDVGSIIPCLITNDTQVGQLYLGYNGGGGGVVIVTNGANFQAGYEGEWTGVGFVSGPGTLIIEPGSSFSCGSHLWVGQGINNQGTVINNGGTISIPSGQFGLSWNGQGGTNYAYITNNAHMYLGQFSPQILGYPYCASTNRGILDIGAGSSIVVSNNNLLTYNFTFNANNPALNGTTVNILTCLETNGQLIAYEGAGTIQAIYNPAGNYTTLTAVAPVNQDTPVFSVEPTNVIASLGGTATLNAKVSNVSANYQWMLNSVPLADGNGVSGSKTATLTIANLTAAETGIYTVVATNSSVATAYTTSTLASLSAQSFNLYPVITINGINGDSYEVQYTTSLTQPVTWTTLGTYTVGAGPLQVVDTATPMSIQRYYQVVQQ